MHIMLIEDNDDHAFLMTHYLNRIDPTIRVTRLSDSELAAAQLTGMSDSFPDLLLVDLDMPHLDGADLIALIKRVDGIRRIPAIIVTSSNSRADRQRCLDANANSFVVKAATAQLFQDALTTLVSYWRHVHVAA